MAKAKAEVSETEKEVLKSWIREFSMKEKGGTILVLAKGMV